MKKSNKTVPIVIVILVLAGAAYLICKKYVKPAGESDKRRIAFVVPTLSNPYFVDMTDSAKALAAKLGGVEVLVQGAEKVEDADGQNQIVENMITKKVDAICVVPTNSESMIPVIKKANTEGIPVINIDNKVDVAAAEKAGIKLATYVGSDNFDGGKLAGEFMIKKLNGKGSVAILEGVSGNDAAIKRKNGFLEALKAAPGIKVVTSQVANWNREQAFTLFQNILKANPGLNGVFACNDEMAMGASAALQQSKIAKDKMVIVGFDAIKDALDALKAGKIDATIAQQPKLMGATGITLALDILAKKPVQSNNSTALKLMTR